MNNLISWWEYSVNCNPEATDATTKINTNANTPCMILFLRELCASVSVIDFCFIDCKTNGNSIEITCNGK